MPIWIGLFRGINVGGNNILPMTELKRDLQSLQLKNVRTYIQSGNVVFEATAKTASSVSKKIARRIEERHGFRPQFLMLSYDDLLRAVESNPFPHATADPKSLHFSFLAEPPVDPNLEAIERLRSPSEKCQLTDRVFYLHAPDGIGRSKLATNAEKHLGVVTTGRNYRTVAKLLSMAAPSNGGR